MDHKLPDIYTRNVSTRWIAKWLQKWRSKGHLLITTNRQRKTKTFTKMFCICFVFYYTYNSHGLKNNSTAERPAESVVSWWCPCTVTETTRSCPCSVFGVEPVDESTASSHVCLQWWCVSKPTSCSWITTIAYATLSCHAAACSNTHDDSWSPVINCLLLHHPDQIRQTSYGYIIHWCSSMSSPHVMVNVLASSELR